MTTLNRRVLLAGAALLGARRATAQDQPAAPPPALPPPAPPSPAVPVPPLATTPPVPPAGAPVPPRPPAATPAATPAIDRTKAYYVYFDQNIDVGSMRALRRQCTSLVEAGVSEITIVLHSSGGLIDPTVTTYSYLRALPCTINAHALGFIGSAANVLFLVGERRTANRNCRFLFHPTTVPFTGTMSSGQMRDRITQFDALGASIAEIYRDRTTFTDAELDRFAREEVIYSADQALAGGLVHAIGDLRIPDATRARIVFLD